MSQLDNKEINLVSGILSKLEPGELPLPIFLQISRLCVLATVEVVPLKYVNNSIQVLLMKRPDNDPTWPGKYHVPGSVVRGTDHLGNFDDAFGRIIKDELGDIAIMGKPVFVETVFRDLGRGKEVTVLYWVQVNDEVKEDNFFNSKNLPDNTIEKQKEFIRMGIEHFIKSKFNN